MKVLLTELPNLARGVLQSLDSARGTSHASVVALRGDLGAGKTTFVQALANELGVVGTVQSPTYVLMKKYAIPQGDALTSGLSKASPFKTFVHIDAYRLERPEEFVALRPEQFLSDPTTLVVVEWPEKLGAYLPKPDLTLNFSSKDAAEGERYIEVV